ncbi:Uncharacterized conserved protein, DUF849 family [Cohaesibacter sp. ES.047]|uniref:3-keto-5-aminohexanoate cleavage protein n=1 Tax=Cohaesibacter sp. ES.047 TaxID=1798205 RepID=UPI000BBFF47C|nr:3-keto-5-aminohexanoate cleavage protein [Cohaesibacter sp. ES.047]SNY90753.1 Uncharacterized conserved protein, DUF849 family [Cohaesibacter sp. ES.047]
MSNQDYSALPKIMVAPNGARRTKADHPALPVTIAETVEDARACWQAGADGIHAHVRDAEQRHCLDAGLYRELLAELARAVPDMQAQITTEAVGLYSPEQQRKLVRDVQPRAVSIAIREMLSEGELPDIARFYHEQRDHDVAIQHILYSETDIDWLADLCSRNIVPRSRLQFLFVLGRYTAGQQSSPEDLDPFMAALERLENHLDVRADWACCAFGQGETDCLLDAMRRGGKVRIGFENNLHHSDGRIAHANAERIAQLIAAMKA